MADRGDMQPDLVVPPGARVGTEQGELPIASQHLEFRRRWLRLTRVGLTRHQHAANLARSADRQIDQSAVLRQRSFHDRQIGLSHLLFLKLNRKLAVRQVLLCHDDQAARHPVQAMDDARTKQAGHEVCRSK